MDQPNPVPGHGSGSLEQLTAEVYPRMLMVQTTSRCNSSCGFCPHRLFRRTLPQGEMTQALFERILSEAAEHPELACINLFLMNEPLVDPRLVERIHLARRLHTRAQISLWTNAVALDPGLGEELLASPLSSLGVSLHAHRPETYRRLTGRTDFHRVLRNVVSFVEQRNARRPGMTVVLRFVAASTMSPAELQELERFWADGGVVLDIDQGHLGRAGNLLAPGTPQTPHTWMAGCRALGGPKQAHVLFNGQVVLCCMDYGRVTSLGDCSRDTLQQIWTGPRRRRYLETLYGVRPAEPGFLCSRCELAIPRREGASTSGLTAMPDDPIWAAA